MKRILSHFGRKEKLYTPSKLVYHQRQNTRFDLYMRARVFRRAAIKGEIIMDNMIPNLILPGEEPENAPVQE